MMASMDFRIADTFTDSLARLTGDEQKAVKTTAFGRGPIPERYDLRLNLTHYTRKGYNFCRNK